MGGHVYTISATLDKEVYDILVKPIIFNENCVQKQTQKHILHFRSMPVNVGDVREQKIRKSLKVFSTPPLIFYKG